MSAFLVEDKTVNTIVSFFYSDVLGTSKTYGVVERALKEIGYLIEFDEQCEKLARDMIDLNCKALTARYGNDGEDSVSLGFKFKISFGNSMVKVVKCLDCWLYQCTEGDVPETSLLYKAMENIRNSMLACIVRNTPEYENENWG